MQTVKLTEDNGSWYVLVDGEPWMRTTSQEKAEELSAAFELAAADDDVTFVKR